MKNILIIVLLLVSFFIFNKKTEAYGECSQYGYMATYDGLGSCKCMSGYAFGKDILGKTFLYEQCEIEKYLAM